MRPAGGAALAWLDPRAPYLGSLLLLVGFRLYMAGRMTVAAEDALITFRYAANWAHGLGPVFNAGERVLGYTSPPWMAWIALGIRLGLDPAAWSRGTLLAADAVTLFALAALLDRHASRAAAWCFGVFFATWPYWSALATTGLEMGGMLALIAFTAWAIDRRHPAAGATLGLLAIFRPEGLLAAAALALWARGRDRAVAAGILLVGVLALVLEYGSPVPQSVLAKAAIYGAPGPFHAKAWWDWTFPMPLSYLLATTSEARNFFMLTLLATPAALAGARMLWPKRTGALAAAVAAGLVVWLAYFATGTSYFFWYFATPLLAWAVLAAAGMPEIVKSRLVYVSLVLAIAGHWTFEQDLYRGRAAAEAGLFGETADYLARTATAGETVFLEPIGTIGYRNPTLRVLDEVGLVSPEVAARRARGAGWYTDLVRQRRPEWLVGRVSMLVKGQAFAGAGAPFRSPEERAELLAGYRLAAQSDTTQSDQDLVVLRRR